MHIDILADSNLSIIDGADTGGVITNGLYAVCHRQCLTTVNDFCRTASSGSNTVYCSCCGPQREGQRPQRRHPA